jgi:cyanophycin synthetase
MVCTEGDVEHVVDASAAGFTLDNSLTFQVQNMLCAVALAWHMGVTGDVVRDAISHFRPDPELMPGSCNIIEQDDATILLDSARQVWTIRSLVRGIRDTAFNRTIVVSDSFQHLPDDQILDAGRLVGRVADVVVMHPRLPESESQEHFKDGLARNGVPPLVFVMPDEHEAIARALSMLNAGDLCVLLTSNVPEAIAVINRS